MAAYYLYKFIDDQIKWIHLDLAASTNEGGLGAIPSTYTGFGVWWSQYFIDHLLKEKI
jgi:leucyl aminopeptidase